MLILTCGCEGTTIGNEIISIGTDMVVDTHSVNIKATPEAVPDSVDAVVIGSGIGGLVSAVQLARHGFSVCVCERHSVPGGYAHDFSRSGYRFDVSLHHIGALGAGTPIHHVLSSLGVLGKLRITPKSSVFTARFPDFSMSVPNDPDGFERELVRIFPDQRSGIRSLLFLLRKLKSHIMGPWVDPDFMVPPDKLINARYTDMTFAELVAEHITDERLRAVFAQFWTLIGLPPELATANFSTCVFNSHFLEGSYDIEGGGAAFSRALVERLTELGGICLTGAEVSDIMLTDGRASGVRTVDGREIHSRLVISNADPQRTFFDLLPRYATRDIFKFRIRKMQPSVSFYNTYLGLDCPPAALGIPENTYFHNHGLSALTAYERAVSGEIHHTDWAVTSYEGSDMADAPEGCGIVSFVEVTPGAPWFNLSDAEYSVRKRNTAEELLQKYNRIFPGIIDHIAVSEFATPKTMARYTGNYHGSIYGLAQTVEQSNSRRLRNVTPVKGLYLTGAWTWAGGGYEGTVMSGIQTAVSVFDTFPPRSTPIPSTAKVPGEQTEHTAAPGFSEAAERTILEKGYDRKRMIVYPTDVQRSGGAGLETLLRFMDRGRVDTGERIFNISGDDSLLKNFTLQVYAIQMAIHRQPVEGETVSMLTKYMKKAGFRAVCHQYLYSEERRTLISEAQVELVNLNSRKELIAIPGEIHEKNDTSPVFTPDGRVSAPLDDRYERIAEMSLRVYTEHTDLQGVTFHVAYVRFSEMMLFDLLSGAGQGNWTCEYRKFYIRYLHATSMGQHLNMRMAARMNDDGTVLVEQKLYADDIGAVAVDICFQPVFRDSRGRECAVPEPLRRLAGG